MKKIFLLTGVAVVASLLLLSFGTPPAYTGPEKTPPFPYKQAGLTREQAAAHLISRFTFGSRPGDVEKVAAVGLENWFAQQLAGNLPDDSLQTYLAPYETLKMSNEEIVQVFTKQGKIVRMAVRDGVISKDSVASAGKKEYREQLGAYMQQKGYKPQQELFRQLINQKILRAACSDNQLREILTDFWFNHFNVSLTKNDCAQYVMAYERDAIRPHVLGRFEDLLVATAKSPAMLTYLDNFTSAGPAEPVSPARRKIQQQIASQLSRQRGDSSAEGMQQADQKLRQAKRTQGLNENYAREIMELHTLGVDGGYTQTDVTQAARVLTGWTLYPMDDEGQGQALRKVIDRIGDERLEKQGFVHEGDFLFAANRHDKGEKEVLGNHFAADGGYQEGLTLLHMLARHPSTAKFICTKLAIRFVSDNPSPALIAKMVKTFSEKDGDISQVLTTMVSAPEFWAPEALREKTKSPFELAISAVRGLDAHIQQPYQLYNWINKMGQRIYYYQAPTGFPDRGQYWINTGSLLNRMNFGLALATQRIPGISFSLLALNHNHEPESAALALVTYSKLLMPQRDLDQTIKRLTPLLNDPELNQKVDEAAGKTAAPPLPGNQQQNTMEEEGEIRRPPGEPGPKKQRNQATVNRLSAPGGTNSMLAQVVGIIIGSPEYQRK